MAPFVFLFLTIMQFVITNTFGACFGGCFGFSRPKKKNKTTHTQITQSPPLNSLQMINPLIDTKSERTGTTRGSSSQNLLHSLGSNSPNLSQAPPSPFTPRCKNTSLGWSNKADSGGNSSPVQMRKGSSSTVDPVEQDVTLASVKDSPMSSDRSYTGTVPCCHEKRDSAEIEQLVNALYYGWLDYVFDEVSIDEAMITRMLLSAHLQIAQIGHDQIEDCFSLLSYPGVDAVEEYQSVYDLFREIPFLLNTRHTADYRIEKLTRNHSLCSIINYLERQQMMISQSELYASLIDNLSHQLTACSIANAGEDSPMQEELIYNLAFRKANNIEEELPDVYRIGKYRKMQTMKQLVTGIQLPTQVAKYHLMNQRSALNAILELVRYETSPGFGHIDRAIAFEYVDIAIMMHELFEITRSVFPDAQIATDMKIHHKLSEVWMPVSLIKLFLMKLALHSRREYWGRNARNLHMHFMFEQIILDDPFDIILRISMTDNCPPIKEPRLDELNRVINHRSEFDCNIEMVDDDFEHREHWLNDVYYFSSWIATLLDGKFGIKNMYNGTGEMQNKHSSTRQMYLEFSILRKTHGEITIDDAKIIEKGGMDQKVLRNALCLLMMKKEQ